LATTATHTFPRWSEVAVFLILCTFFLWGYGKQKIAANADRACAVAEAERKAAIEQRDLQVGTLVRLQKENADLEEQSRRLSEQVKIAGVQRLQEYDATLAKQIRWLGALQDFRDVLSTPETDRTVAMQQVVAYVLYGVFELIGAKITCQGSVAVPLPSEPYLTIAYGVGVDDHSKDVRRFSTRTDLLPKERGVAGMAFVSGKYEIDHDIQHSEIYQPRPDRPIALTPYDSILAYPIMAGNRKLGVLCLNGRSVGCFNEDFHVRVAGAAAAVLAQAMLAASL